MKILFLTILLQFILGHTGIKHRDITGPSGEVEPVADTVDIMFIGDIMSHTAQIEAAGKYGYEGYFSGIREMVEECDLAVGNMECPIGAAPYSGYPCFSAPFALAEEAAASGIDIFLFANNHICDKGSRGIRSTIESMDILHERFGTVYTGIFPDAKSKRPLIVERNGLRIAFLNFTYGTNGIPVPKPYHVNLIDTTGIRQDIIDARENGCDIIIALPHWGDEYVLRHNRSQEKLAGWLRKNGTDIVIGTHPHVPQDIGEIDGMPVVYSLGNYISNMSAENTQLGLAVTVRIVRRSNMPARASIASVDYLWCRRPGYGNRNYTVVPVWQAETQNHDYRKMSVTVNRVEKTLKIQERFNTWQETGK